MKKTLICALLIQLLSSSICYADRYISTDSDFNDSADKPMWWLLVYFAIGLWAFLSKNGPLREFGDRSPAISGILFLFVIPGILMFMFR